MTAPTTVVLPNVLSNAAAPNTLSSMPAGPGRAPDANSGGRSTRQLWRVVLFGGFAVILLIEIIASRSW